MWIPLVSAAEVPSGGIVAVDLEDRQLVVWRTATGRAAVCDARCPHQWSHLEAEGVVDGDELVCTAHFWRFDAEGHGTKRNVLGRRDEKSAVETFSSREEAGMVEVDWPRSNPPGAGTGGPGSIVVRATGAGPDDRRPQPRI
ncbi:MAG: Rieske (2Fe-2S) protein [Actinobacteria bacterium]|nr:Rieske (2Fe-2S) protein [Actinomycetota bacterium]